MFSFSFVFFPRKSLEGYLNICFSETTNLKLSKALKKMISLKVLKLLDKLPVGKIQHLLCACVNVHAHTQQMRNIFHVDSFKSGLSKLQVGGYICPPQDFIRLKATFFCESIC